MKNLNLAFLGLLLLILSSCGGKKSNEDTSSTRIIIGTKTDLTPTTSSSELNYQKVDFGTTLTGKHYTKIVQYRADRNGFFSLASSTNISGFCAQKTSSENFTNISAEFKVKYEGSATFETVDLTRKMLLEGVYLNEGDELNIHLSLKSTQDCAKVTMTINTSFF